MTSHTSAPYAPAPWFWGDVETSGLDPHQHSLLEVAGFVTEAAPGVPVVPGSEFSITIAYDYDALTRIMDASNDYVRNMHTKTGLWARIAEGQGTPLADADSWLVDHLARFTEPGRSPFAGNSVRLDMNFFEVHLPQTYAFLDYHMRDVSTLAGIASDLYGTEWFEKKSDHTAMTDIRESREEFLHYVSIIENEGL